MIINLIAKYIYADIQISWTAANEWLDGLSPNDYAYQNLDTSDIQTIQNNAASCETDTCALQTPEEVKVYLKYCTFNLAECAM
ncbi:hypothetical protein KKG31_01680 [Patescibacteria group bacterium]|nr:hypothetical protein [Patescibacteria group bacterium]MBU1757883.1 hypothetical protein [Patescibacteria group bacterium]